MRSESVRAGLPVILLAVVVAIAGLSRGQDTGAAAKPTGRTFFVAADGNDSFDGLAAAPAKSGRGPFRTLARASRAVRPGDTVQVRAGVYPGYGGSWGFEVDGTKAKPITIMSFPGETAVIDGAERTLPKEAHTPLMQVYGDWYIIRDLEFRGGTDAGLSVQGDHCTAKNISSHHNRGSGMLAIGRWDTFEDCRVWSNSLINQYGTMPIGWGFGISLCANARDSTIRRCTSWNNWGEGLSIASGYDCTIEDCVSYDNFSTNIYVCQSVRGLCRRNLSYYTDGNPLQRFVSSQNCIIVADEANPPDSTGNTVVNNVCLGGDRCLLVGGDEFQDTLIAFNTFVQAFSRLRSSEQGCVYITAGASTGGRFADNIVDQQGRVPVCHSEARGVAFDHNAWTKRPPSPCRGAGDVFGNPRLLKTGPTAPGSLTRGWFALTASSPARDRGVSLRQVTEDLARRPRGAPPDIGAWESGAPPATARSRR